MDKTFWIFAIALISAALMIFTSVSIQSSDAKLDARGLVMAGLEAKNSSVQLQAPAKISIILIDGGADENLISLYGLQGEISKIEGIETVSRKKLLRDSKEALELIAKYNIEKIPSIILEGETAKSGVLSSNWPKFGTIENDGAMVLRSIPPLYYETKTGVVRGKVNAIYISVDDRNEVFNSSEVYRQVLEFALGIVPREEESANYTSERGKELIAKYDLREIPTFILAGDLNAYANYPKVLLGAGEMVQGDFVFRDVKNVRGIKYLDLNSGLVISTENDQGAQE